VVERRLAEAIKIEELYRDHERFSGKRFNRGNLRK
jgi:hypothetical protein